MSPVQELSETLRGLQGGQRYWFWLAASAPPGGAPLVLRSLTDDIGRLVTATSHLPLHPAVSRCLGIAEVTGKGTLRLVSSDAEVSQLRGLARWTRTVDPEAFGRLANLTLVGISEDGRVEQVFGDDALWLHLSPQPIPGTLAAGVRAFQNLEFGVAAWFFATDAEQGFVHLVPVAHDETGAAFLEALPGLFRRFARGRHLVGSLQKVSESAVAVAPILGDAEAESILGIVATRHDDLTPLAEAYLPDRIDVSTTRAALADLAPGDEVYFVWLQGAMIAVDRERSKLLTLAEDLGRTVRARGRIVDHGEGGLEVRTKEDVTGLLQALVTFVGRHRGEGVDRLIRCRLAIRDAEGNLTSRFENDEAWALLEDARDHH